MEKRISAVSRPERILYKKTIAEFSSGRVHYADGEVNWKICRAERTDSIIIFIPRRSNIFQPGELEKQMALLEDSHNIQNVNVSEQDPSAAEEEAVKQSVAIDEAFKNYLRFYAARIIKQNSSQQQ